MALKLTEVRRGHVVKLDDGVYYKVMDLDHRTRGNLRGFIQVTLKNMQTGSTATKRFASTDSLESAYLSKKNCQYLYPEGKMWVFMDNTSYEQFHLDEDVCGDAMKYVRLNQDVVVNCLDDKPVEIELPAAVTLEVVEADPAIRGNTATNVTKRAVCDTGLEIKVPQHVGPGDLVSIDTRTGEFLSRAKKENE